MNTKIIVFIYLAFVTTVFPPLSSWHLEELNKYLLNKEKKWWNDKAEKWATTFVFLGANS